MSRLLLAALALVAGLLGLRAAPPVGEPAEPTELKLATTADSKAEYQRAVAPFIARHCAGCHGAKTAKGDLDLTALDPDMKTSTSGARWAQVVEKLATGEMPPKGRPRPTD